MKKIFILISMIFISANSYAGGGRAYECESIPSKYTHQKPYYLTLSYSFWSKYNIVFAENPFYSTFDYDYIGYNGNNLKKANPLENPAVVRFADYTNVKNLKTTIASKTFYKASLWKTSKTYGDLAIYISSELKDATQTEGMMIFYKPERYIGGDIGVGWLGIGEGYGETGNERDPIVEGEEAIILNCKISKYSPKFVK